MFLFYSTLCPLETTKSKLAQNARENEAKNSVMQHFIRLGMTWETLRKSCAYFYSGAQNVLTINNKERAFFKEK